MLHIIAEYAGQPQGIFWGGGGADGTGQRIDLLEQPRRRRWPLFVLAAGLVLLIAALPRLAVLLPAGVQRVDAALAARFVPRYEARLASLQAENTALHKHLAGAQIALAENDALRQWAGIERPAGVGRPRGWCSAGTTTQNWQACTP